MRRPEQQTGAINTEASDPDEVTLDTLYRRYGGWLMAALRRRFGASIANIADDLVQETYIRIAPYQAAGVIRHPQALLMQVASNIARDQMRRDDAKGQSLRAPMDALAESPQGAVQSEQFEALHLKEIVMALPVKYRDVFVLSRFGGLTYEEIAHHFGLSIKTVEWRMTKALALCALRLRD